MFTDQHFKHYIELIGMNRQCPCCQKDEWAYYAETRMNDVNTGQLSSNLDNNSITGLVALTVNRDGKVTDVRLGGIGQAQMLCLNCGYQLLFNYHFIRQRYNELLTYDTK